tara:strand:- start:382 stop:672 length:291 start_codon:yes stop_codon:yes gene_type:complete
MHTVIRHYSGPGASELAEQISAQTKGVEAEIRSVPGVISYALVKTVDGCISITVCEDKAGADQSVKVAAEFVRDNCTAQARPPVVSEGETIIHFRT